MAKRLPILLLLIAAFVVRVHALGAQSLWHDEGASLYYASLAPAAAVAELAELGEIPPLYFLLLHVWMQLAGQTEFGLRFLSVAGGILGVALLHQLGRRLAGDWVGFFSALLLAVSPLHIWQSQEARMYTLVVLLGILSFQLLLQLTTKPHRPTLLAYSLVAVAGLYTHLTFALVLAAQGVYCLAWLATDPGGRLGRAGKVFAAMLAATVAFSPWLMVALGTYETGSTFWPGRLDVVGAARDTLAAFVVGERALGGNVSSLARHAAALLAAGLLAAGLSPPRRSPADSGSPTMLLACYLLVPAVVTALMLLDRPKYGPRYLLVALPAFCLLWGWATLALPEAVRAWRARAAGLATPAPARGPAAPPPVSSARPRTRGPTPAHRWRVAILAALGLPGSVLGGAALVLSLSASEAQFVDPRWAREDVRGVAHYLATQASEDDAVILLGGHLQLPFLHYYRDAANPGRAPVHPLPDRLMAVLAKPLQADDVALLNAIVPGRHRVWVVRWQDSLADPAGVTMQQLEMAGRRVDPGQAFHGVHLDAFEVPGRPVFPMTFVPSTPLAATFGDALDLLGYDLAPESAEPGQTLRLTLYWRAAVSPAGDYAAFTQLLNHADHIYAQHDKPPVSELYPTSRWAAGDLLKDEYQLRVSAGAPPGRYRLQMGLYDRQTFARVPVHRQADDAPDDRLILAEIAVRQADPVGPGAETLHHRTDVELAPGISLVGFEAEPEPLPRGGESRLKLLWFCREAAPVDYDVRLSLVSSNGAEIATSEGPPADGAYPTTHWRAGDLVLDIHNLIVPPEAPAGRYDLVVSLLAPAGPTETATVGGIEIE